MINIIGGVYKRKRINVPEKKVRPTSAIKRESIFSQNGINLLRNYISKLQAGKGRDIDDTLSLCSSV